MTEKKSYNLANMETVALQSFYDEITGDYIVKGYSHLCPHLCSWPRVVPFCPQLMAVQKLWIQLKSSLFF